MAKYTKSQAKKALRTIDDKVFKLYNSGHISSGCLLGITGYTEKAMKKLK